MKPLAERIRPKSLEEYVGQSHLVGPEGLLRKVIRSGQVPSMILWGPPGTGKTTLAKIIANETQRPFQSLSAISSGVKDVREAITKARKQHFFDQPGPLLFIDEIHRFNKGQQDALLGAVEDGTIVLIGATTENPSFEVNSALLSRCQVYTLQAFGETEYLELLERALSDERIKRLNIKVPEIGALVQFASGDARRFLNLLEVMAEGHPGEAIGNDLVLSEAQALMQRYDKSGEQHYDMASAMIKSIRGSDPQASLYWMARMLEGGEDVKFIARRLIISAAEDIGLANPNALLMANQCAQAVQMVGMPEARIILSQAIIYLATSEKSNAAYLAIDEALAQVRETGDLPVPLHLRNAPTKLMKDLDYGKGYKYPHDYEGHFVEQLYLPEQIAGSKYYFPQDNQTEHRIKLFLERITQQKSKKKE